MMKLGQMSTILNMLEEWKATEKEQPRLPEDTNQISEKIQKT
jgi:hypothetical protein